MSQPAFQMAFDRHLESFAAGTLHAAHKATLVVGQRVFEPVTGQPYYTGRLAAYTRRPLGIGPVTTTEHRGSYQITVNRPLAEGDRTAALIAEELAAHFGRAVPIAAMPGATHPAIVIEASTPQPGYSSGGWFTVPVIVSWFATG